MIIIRCLRCGRTQPRRGPTAIYICEHCRAMFDDDPDEGGDFSDRNPAARLEREERNEERRRQQRRRT